MHKAGQNTAEYLILMTLVVVPLISLLTVYGSQIHQKISYLASSLSGSVAKVDEAKQMGEVVSYEAMIRARQNEIGMEGISKDELSYGPGR